MEFTLVIHIGILLKSESTFLLPLHELVIFEWYSIHEYNMSPRNESVKISFYTNNNELLIPINEFNAYFNSKFQD